MKYVLVFVGLLLPISAAAQNVSGSPTDLNMVVAFDRSESISPDEVEMQIEGLIFGLTHPNFLSAVASGYHRRIGLSVIKWSSFLRYETLMPWRIIRNRSDALSIAKVLRAGLKLASTPNGSQTDIAQGIELATRLLDDVPYSGSRQVINIVADGGSNIGRIPSVDRDKAVQKGITINALIFAQGTAIRILRNYFEREVIGGPSAFVHHARTPDDFPLAMLRKMTLELSLLRGQDPA